MKKLSQTNFNHSLKRKLLIFAVLSFLGFIIPFGYMFRSQPIMIGVYDPSGAFDNQGKFKIQNVYITWGEESDKITNLLRKNDSLQRTSLVTVEPWQNTNTEISGKELLTDINQGKYDETILRVCGVLAKTDLPPIIRWGHEMELTNSRYPWANNDPTLYKESYKHFVNLCKTQSTKFKFMWSPAGENGTKKYWPGEDYVDFIGLSIYSFHEWDLKFIGHQRSFSEVLTPKYERIKQFNKPVIVAEVGVTGDESYQKQWINKLVQDFNDFNLLRGFVYFNAVDRPGAWGNDLGIADFTIKEDSLDPLLQAASIKDNLP